MQASKTLSWLLRHGAVEESSACIFQVPPNGGVSTGGVSRSGLVLPLLSFFVLFFSFLGLSRFFWDFPDLLGDGPGISCFVLFLFLGL